MTLLSSFRRCAALLGLAAGLMAAGSSQAVPSYARQTGQDCVACHVGGFGPQLTPFGVKFKMGGYTDTDGQSGKVPLSGMVVGSFTHTGKDQAEAPAPGSRLNDNRTLDEASLFIAGKLADQLGSFMQITYDGVGKSSSLDQMDLRFAHVTDIGGKDLILGATLNNNPGVQDPFNTLPVWSFPYAGSPLGFGGVETGTLINGGLEQHVLGLTGYAFYDNSWYAELGAYRGLSRTAQERMSLGTADDPGRVAGNTAYWRLAWFKDLKRQAWSAGVFGFNAGIQPDRLSGGPTNRYHDLGVDAQYQFLGTRDHIFTVQGSHIWERQSRDAMLAAGEASHAGGYLRETKLNASYTWLQTWGFSVGRFLTTGDSDATLYSANAHNKPNTQGTTFQADWTPWGKEGSWLAPWANLRLGAQYTAYSEYNGAARNYDGSGRKASDNNTLFLFAWTSF
ncbi:cytochrome c1 protein [Ideonella azotifigens]|uniref:Cytochrome c n=1 Tax=Ideonella azotifigens TaxID=513160 RepID=A0ABN1K971_9BURK|nr:cytochrome C [Ideonella azotifigens]MCD2342865.1 cytochrome c1 protein [Ideonella azotifigens]